MPYLPFQNLISKTQTNSKERELINAILINFYPNLLHLSYLLNYFLRS